MPAHNVSVRAEQRKLRDRMRGLGMSHAEIAAELARRYKLRPRAAWRTAFGWTLEEAAERYNALRGKGDPGARAALTGSRLSEWENWPFSVRKPPIAGLCLLAAIYQVGVLDLVDFDDREKMAPAELLTLDKVAAIPAARQDSRLARPGPARRGIRRPPQEIRHRGAPASSLMGKVSPRRPRSVASTRRPCAGGS